MTIQEELESLKLDLDYFGLVLKVTANGMFAGNAHPILAAIDSYSNQKIKIIGERVEELQKQIEKESTKSE